MALVFVCMNACISKYSITLHTCTNTLENIYKCMSVFEYFTYKSNFPQF